MCDPNWFRALCEISIGAAIGCLYRLRTRQIATLSTDRSVLHLTARERIAMELHDALLQDTQGLLLMFQGLSGRLPQQHPLRAQMEATLDQADLLLKVARERAWEQLSTGTQIDIGTAIRHLSEASLSASGPLVSLLVLGRPRPVQRGAAAEISHFAREALSNAATRANATEVEVEIEYGRKNVRVRIRDDGSGLDATVQRETLPPRLALFALSQKLQRSGLRLCVWSGHSSGTEVELIIDAASAYQ